MSVSEALIAVAAGSVAIAALYFGQEFLIPLTLAFILSFLLAPLANRLQRWGLGHFIPVLLSVGLATVVATVIALVVAYQVISLADSLPRYQSNIEQKIRAVRQAPAGPYTRMQALFTSLEKTATAPTPIAPLPGEPAGSNDLPRYLTSPNVDPTNGATAALTPAGASKDFAPATETPSITPMGVFRYIVGTTLGPLGSAAVVLVLVIFTLLERNEIRARLLRLLGSRPGQLYASTQALDAAASRVSRFLVMQTIVNVTYGVPIGLGLYVIGVPSPFLWALLTIVLRFIPYVGPLIGGAMPVALALAVDPGWTMFIWTLGLFVVVELISNNFVEPVLYGRSTGVTPVGIILAAVFWAWLWGPIGLLIATPITVCLVVLGEHIPAMSLFPLLLGDRPVLPLHARIYQRLLAMDVDEPDELSRTYLADHSLDKYYDEVLVPLLRLLEVERHFHALELPHREFIIARVGELITDMAEHAASAPLPAPSPTPGPPAIESAETVPPTLAEPLNSVEPTVSAGQRTLATVQVSSPLVLTVAADDDSDELVARMLAVLLQRRGVRAEAGTLLLPARAAAGTQPDAAPTVICISALPPTVIVQARRQILRARTLAPSAATILGVWDTEVAAADVTKKLSTTNPVTVVTTLEQAVERVVTLVTVEGKPPSGP